MTGLHEGITVVKRKTNELLAAGDNFTITQATGFPQGQFIVFGVLYQMHDFFEFDAGFAGLLL